ncbi:hypothetical protein J7E87_06325 [Streptomyces sp. ISL-1]|nr:hypothetical protein [Streptomyces sp. ISL-1]
MRVAIAQTLDGAGPILTEAGRNALDTGDPKKYSEFCSRSGSRPTHSGAGRAGDPAHPAVRGRHGGGRGAVDPSVRTSAGRAATRAAPQ